LLGQLVLIDAEDRLLALALQVLALFDAAGSRSEVA
jgi:hypothetical protein